ncbi:Aldo/keto reductase [Massarina eburnea CBS 473.64]|uniref:Aldo/keto reductase n=1 Tax=Massarina eburnea CBS 473.64 TaxID=1395130 RepID=A0A6A6RVP1_9PLEO|nr:Aldo/keto reductase [Massarina eburnea CBS 473.64]
MDFNPSVDEQKTDWLPVLDELGIKVVDVSPTYPPWNPHLAEKIIGMSGIGKAFTIDTKVNWTGDGSGSMTESAMSKSVDESLAAIGTEKVSTRQTHLQDKVTPIAEQAAAVDALYRQKKFVKFGVCNFPTSVLEEWLEVADANGYVKPSIYQGHYNIICRIYEETIFPVLRKHKIHFIAHSPLGGGFLTGRLTFAASENDVKGTRLESGTDLRGLYDKPAMHAAVRKLEELGKPYDINVNEAALRWSFYHSVLDGGPLLKEEGDAVIIGPRTPAHLRTYEDAYIKGPLPDDFLNEVDNIWEGCKEEAKSIVGW